jgi:hypothetical protein
MRIKRILGLAVSVALSLTLATVNPSAAQPRNSDDVWVQLPPPPRFLVQGSDAPTTNLAPPPAPSDLASCAAAATASGIQAFNRFTACSAFRPAFLWREGTGGSILGEIRGRVTFFAVAQRLERRVTMTIMIDQVTASGSGRPATLGSLVRCTPVQGSLPCSWSSREEKHPASAWEAGLYRSFTYDITNDTQGSVWPDRVKTAKLEALYSVSSVANPVPSLVGFGNPQVRCDSASYITGTGGCAFPNGTPIFTISISGDPAAREAAEHWRAAIDNPSTTIPQVAGKIIPSVLRRTRDQAIIDANRAAARFTCNNDPAFANVNKTGKSCDEYPFATTLEGAASGTNYSVRWITASHNTRAGSLLASFYQTSRVLSGDFFWVAVSD